jgi:hypothetical protein
MKIISLSSNIAGPACAVSTSIKKYFYDNNYKTNIFDYLELSLESINEVINIMINNIQFTDKLKENNEFYVNKDNNISVIFKYFNKIISHHDLMINFVENDYNILINKYERRYNRLKDYLYNEDIIFFIRYGIENKETIINFINKINTLNKSLKVFFININYDEIKEYDNQQYNDIENYIYINFFNYIDNNIEYNENLYYKTIQFNWNIIKDIIYSKI